MFERFGERPWPPALTPVKANAKRFPVRSGAQKKDRPRLAPQKIPPPNPEAFRNVDNERTAQTQRANLFPEVSSPFCRLPLPTLFYGLEAAHLGDLMRLWVQSGTESVWNVWAPFNFHASIEPVQTLHETRSALLTFLSLILNQAESDPTSNSSQGRTK